MIENLKIMLAYIVGLIVALIGFYIFVKVCIYAGLILGGGYFTSGVVFFLGCCLIGYFCHEGDT